MSTPRPSRAVGIGIFAFSAGLQVLYAILVLAKWGHTFLNSDTVSHTYIARLLWYRIENIGGVWLPLYHILIAPFTLVPALYSTGLSGVVVNAVATGLTSVILYRMLPNRYGILVGLVLAGNFLTLSYSATSSQEPTAVLFGVGAIYYIREYIITDKRVSFFKTSVLLSIGEFTRYEIWALAAILVVFFALRETRRGRRRNIAFAHLAFWGVFLWLLWDTAIFRDPLAFLHGPGRLGVNRFLLTPSLSMLLSILSRADLQYEILVGLIATSLILFRNKTRFVMPGALFLLAVSLPVQATSLAYTSFGNGNDYPIYYSQILKDAALWEQVAVRARSSILISSWAQGGSDYLSVFSGVDPSNIIDEYNPIFVKASARPWHYADFVVMRKADCACVFSLHQRYWGSYFNYLFYSDPAWRDLFDARFRPIYSNSRFVLYERVVF